MPKTKSAKKALSVSLKRKKYNQQFKARIKSLIKKFKSDKQKDTLKKLISLLDKAASKNVIHKNKSSRLKSRLSRLIKKTPKSKETTKKVTAKDKQ